MKRSTNVIVSNLSGDKILLLTSYTGLFFYFLEKKKLGGARPPPATPLTTALALQDFGRIFATYLYRRISVMYG